MENSLKKHVDYDGTTFLSGRRFFVRKDGYKNKLTY